MARAGVTGTGDGVEVGVEVEEVCWQLYIASLILQPGTKCVRPSQMRENPFCKRNSSGLCLGWHFLLQWCDP